MNRAIGVISALLLGTRGGAAITEQITLFQITGYLGLCASVVLIMRVGRGHRA